MSNTSSQERISQKMSQNSGKKPKSNIAIIAVSFVVGVAAGIVTFALVSTQKPAATIRWNNHCIYAYSIKYALGIYA